MSARRGIVCAGCWTLDRVKLIDAWPAEETLATIGSIERQGGGSAHNVAIDLKRLDPSLPVAGVGLFGRDADGDLLLERAAAHGVDTAALRRDGRAATSFTDVMTVRGSGRRTFFHHPGTNDLLTPDHVDLSASTARFLHLGLLGVHATLDAPWQDEPNGWVAILKAARAAGLETSIELVSIDPGRNRELALPCLPHVDRLIVNDQEIGALAGIETLVGGVADAGRCLEAARRVLALGAMSLVVAHFPAGAVAVGRGGESFRRASLALGPDEIVGSVGAGDAFAAGVLYALHEGREPPAALALGHAVAATSLRSATTVDSVGTLAECDALAGSIAG